MDPIVKHAWENFRRAKADSLHATLPAAGGRWENYCSNARVKIEGFARAEDVITYVQTAETGIESRTTGPALAEQCKALETLCEQMFPEFVATIPTFAETPYSTPETVTQMRGRSVSAPLLWHMRTIMAIISKCRPDRILEIGGGYGAPGRVWLTNELHKPTIYIDVDFPEILFYAEVYLRATLPSVEVVYMHKDAAIPVAGRHPSIFLCPIHTIDKVLGAADLVVNTGSMQEMSDEYVAFYTDKIERSSANMFYSFNRFGQELSEPSEQMNFAAPTPGTNWKAELKRFVPGVRSRAEQFFIRTGPVEHADAQDIFDAPDPRDGPAFLELFDAARRVNTKDLFMEAAKKAMRGLPVLPREVVWLARMASPQSEPDRSILADLERLAAASDSYGVQDHAIAGHIDRADLVSQGQRFKLKPGYAGSIEAAMEIEGGVAISGWAGDLPVGQPAISLIATVNGKITSKTLPVGRRTDIEAGYGAGVRPAQFTVNVPFKGEHQPLVRLFCITSENTAIELKAVRQLFASAQLMVG